METRVYDIVFPGALVPGCDIVQVKAELARLFKTDIAAIERLFCGRPVIIKKGLDRQTADKYKAVMEKAGAICELRAQVAAATASPSAGTPDGQPAMTIAPAGDVLTVPREVPSPEFNLAHISLAATGADILEGVESVTVAPLYDLSALSMALPGAELVEARQTAPADLPDFGDMSVDTPGANLDTRAPPAPALLPDISGISLAPPGTAVLQSGEAKAPPAPPDISGLKLALE
ncbi:MAG: hypothetical protein IT488_14070 [Gammaproteobacteria bacterium]|nr:hypothetical protein [Gammaproteobacteria bacterium]